MTPFNSASEAAASNGAEQPQDQAPEQQELPRQEEQQEDHDEANGEPDQELQRLRQEPPDESSHDWAFSSADEIGEE